MIPCLWSLKPVLIHEVLIREVLKVQIELEEIDLSILASYGAQECTPVAVREQFRGGTTSTSLVASRSMSTSWRKLPIV